METNGKRRIAAWVSLVLTGLVLFGAVRVADQEFSGGVAMALLSLIMICITIVLFANSSKTPKRVATSPQAETASKETYVVDLPAQQVQPARKNESNKGLKKSAKVLYLLGAIFGAISIFMYLWAWYGYYISGEFAGSGGMAGIVFLGVLAVTVPATLIVMFFALILHFASGRE